MFVELSDVQHEKRSRRGSQDLLKLLLKHHPEKLVPGFGLSLASKQDVDAGSEIASAPIVPSVPVVVEPEIVGQEALDIPAFLPRSSSAVNKISLSKRNPHLSNTETPSLHIILAAVMKYFSLSRSRILSARRELKSTLPRQIACYLAAELTQHSLPVIGRDYGGREHTTVIHANRKIARLIEEDEKVASDVNEIKKIIFLAMERA